MLIEIKHSSRVSVVRVSAQAENLVHRMLNEMGV